MTKSQHMVRVLVNFPFEAEEGCAGDEINSFRLVFMKVAIACDGKDVSAHFGHCEGYAVYNATDSVIAYSETLQSPGHEPGLLPVFLAEHGINLVIAGGMGARAVQLFNDNNIEVILGVSGPFDLAAQDYIAGKLKSTGSICSQHEHAHECSGH